MLEQQSNDLWSLVYYGVVKLVVQKNWMMGSVFCIQLPIGLDIGRHAEVQKVSHHFWTAGEGCPMQQAWNRWICERGTARGEKVDELRRVAYCVLDENQEIVGVGDAIQ